MVLDTSALLAILGDEPEREEFNRAIARSHRNLISTASLLETHIVIESRYGEEGSRDLQLLIAIAKVEPVPFDVNQTAVAVKAYRDYGKGRHVAGLNYGDCFAYALAKTMDLPLLFKGDDFSMTDVRRALL